MCYRMVYLHERTATISMRLPDSIVGDDKTNVFKSKSDKAFLPLKRKGLFKMESADPDLELPRISRAKVAVLGSLTKELRSCESSTEVLRKTMTILEVPTLALESINVAVQTIALSIGAESNWFSSAVVGGLVLSGTNLVVSSVYKFIKGKYNKENTRRLELDAIKNRLLEAIFANDHDAVDKLKDEAEKLLRQDIHV